MGSIKCSRFHQIILPTQRQQYPHYHDWKHHPCSCWICSQYLYSFFLLISFHLFVLSSLLSPLFAHCYHCSFNFICLFFHSTFRWFRRRNKLTLHYFYNDLKITITHSIKITLIIIIKWSIGELRSFTIFLITLSFS